MSLGKLRLILGLHHAWKGHDKPLHRLASPLRSPKVSLNQDRILLARHGGSHLQSQHFGRPRWVDHLRLGVQDQPGQHGETPSLLKIQKLTRCGGVCL